MSNDLHVTNLNLGAFNGATELPLAYFGDAYGDVTILSGYLVGPSAGTVVGGLLVTMSTAGTPALTGTVGSFAGTVVTAAGVPGALTLSNGGTINTPCWVGFDQTSGTVPAGTFITINYTTGR